MSYRKFIDWVPSVLEWVSSGIQVLTNLATLGAFALAAYAFAYPATVSEYLERVADASEATVENTARTADNTGRTADNTNQLAGALPRWLGIEVFADGDDCPSNCELYISVANESSENYSNAEIVIFDTSRKASQTFQLGTIFARDDSNVEFLSSETVSAICLIATNASSGTVFAEHRDMLPYNENSNEIFFGDNQFDRLENVIKCQF